MKTIRKILGIALVMCCVLSMAGCGASMEKAEWGGYTGMPFIEYLQIGLERSHRDVGDVEVNVSVTCEEGWDYSEELIPSQAAQDPKPVTYIARVDDVDGYYEAYFFAELDTTLTIRGGKFLTSEDGDEAVHNLSAEEAREMLDELREYVY